VEKQRSGLEGSEWQRSLKEKTGAHSGKEVQGTGEQLKHQVRGRHGASLVSREKTAPTAREQPWTDFLPKRKLEEICITITIRKNAFLGEGQGK